MNTHESYVSLETANMLKEAGFDWECNAMYASVGSEFNFYYGIPKLTNKNNDEYSSPTLEVAQRWLREVKCIEVNILCVYIGDNKKYSYIVFKGKYNQELIIEGFDTYEEAQEAGIKKALEMILRKGNKNYGNTKS